jgi:hypothetical protein
MLMQPIRCGSSWRQPDAFFVRGDAALRDRRKAVLVASGFNNVWTAEA